MKKINPKLVFCLLLLLLTTIIIYIFITEKDVPKVDASVELSNITLDEYESIVDANKVEMADIKKISINVEITNSKSCKEREIIIPELNEIDHYDFVRSYQSEDASINNVNKEEVAISTKYIIFNSTNLSLEDIKRLYSNKNIDVNILMKQNEKISYRYDIGQLIK
jgi:hypothetical protein